MFRASNSDDYIVSSLVQNVIWIAIVLESLGETPQHKNGPTKGTRNFHGGPKNTTDTRQDKRHYNAIQVVEIKP